MDMKRWGGIWLLVWFSQVAWASPTSPDFSSGTWYKIGFPRGGIYYLDQRWFQSQGISWRSIRPSQVQFWAGDPRALPQRIDEHTSLPNELNEVPVWSTFAGDRWGRSGRLYFYVASAQRPEEEKHPYSDSTFVYLRLGENLVGRKVQPLAALVQTSAEPSVEEVVQVIEKEEHSLVRSGRHWFGDYLSTGLSTRQWALPTPERLPQTGVRVAYRGISTVTVESSLRTERSPAIRLPRIGTGRYDRKGQWVEWQEIWQSEEWAERLNLTFTPAAGSGGGFYLDRLIWRYLRQLNFSSDPVIWRGSGVMEATVAGWAWSQETGALHPVSVGRRQLAAGGDTWILWTEKQARPAGTSRRVNLQSPSVHPNAQMILITAPAFWEQAVRYATWKMKHQGVQTDVWTTEQVYARFSAGMPDPTALRNLILRYYRQPETKIQHVLLMGDASYDPKNHLRFPSVARDQLIPTYVSRESLEPIYSFNSDDYFGFMEEGEGEWPEGERRGGIWWNDPSGNHTMDISVGRLPVRDVEQARSVVDKLIRYQTTLGGARGIVLAADDGDELLHQQDAEALSWFMANQRPDIEQQKVYLGAFSERVAGRVPQATDTFFRLLEDSPAFVNYTGHGSELVLAEERLFESDMISRWRNVPRPPIWVTATCEFGRFDNPALVSAGEALVLAPNGGAIALLTTTRPVFSNTNFILNYALYQEALSGEVSTLGELFQRTKNLSIVGVLNRNFTLLGDPSLPLPWPKPTINVVPRDEKGLVVEGFVGDSLGNGTIVAEVFLPERFYSIQDPSGLRMQYPLETKGPMFTFPVVSGKFSGELPDTFPAGSGNIRWRWQNRSGVSPWVKTTRVLDTTPPNLEVQAMANGSIRVVASDVSGLYQGIWPDEAAAQFSWDGERWFPIGTWDLTSDGKYMQNLGAPAEGVKQVSLRISDTHTNQAIGTFIWGENEEPLVLGPVHLYPNPVSGPLHLSISLGEGLMDSEVTVEFFDPLGARLYVRTESCYICDSIWKMTLPEPLPHQGIAIYRVRVMNRWNQQTYQTQGRLYFAR